MLLYTVQVSRIRKIEKEGVSVIHTSVKLAPNSFMAPLWDMVLGHKEKRISDAEYTERYYALLRARYLANPKEWIEFLQLDNVAVSCFCPVDAFCHRRLLVDILGKVAKHHGIDFTYGGEL